MSAVGKQMTDVTEGEVLSVRRIPNQERIALTIAIPIGCVVDLTKPVLLAYVGDGWGDIDTREVPDA